MPQIRSGLAYLSVAHYVSMLFGITKVIVASRYLSPDEMGVFSIGFGFAYFAQTIRQFGVGDFVVANDNIDNYILRQCFTVALLFSTLISLIFVLSANYIATFFDAATLREMVLLLALSFLTTPFIIISEHLLQRRMLFGKLGILYLATGTVDCVVIVTLVVYGVGAISLAWGAVAMGFVGILVVAILDPRHLIFWPQMRGLRPVLRFGGLATLSTLVFRVGDLAPTIIIGRVLNTTEVGYYSRGQAATTFFRQAVEFSTGRVAQSWFADAARRDATLLSDNYARVIRLITGLAWPFYIILYFNAPTLVPLLFGDQWDESVPVAQALAVGGMFSHLTFYGMKLMVGRGLVDRQLKFDVATQVFRIGLLLIAVQHGILAVAWAMSISHLVNFAFMLGMLARTSGLRFVHLVSSCRASLLVGGSVTLLNFAIYWWLPTTNVSVVTLGMIGILSAAVWASGLVLLDHDIWREIRGPLAQRTFLGRWL